MISQLCKDEKIKYKFHKRDIESLRSRVANSLDQQKTKRYVSSQAEVEYNPKLTFIKKEINQDGCQILAISTDTNHKLYKRRHRTEKHQRYQSNINFELGQSKGLLEELNHKNQQAIYLRKVGENRQNRGVVTSIQHYTNQKNKFNKTILYQSSCKNKIAFPQQQDNNQKLFYMPNLSNSMRQNYGHLYDSYDQIEKLTHQTKVNQMTFFTSGTVQNETKFNSIVPAFPQAHPIKYKQKYQKLAISDSIYDYILIKKAKEQIEKALIVESKKQTLLINHAKRCKNKKESLRISLDHKQKIMRIDDFKNKKFENNDKSPQKGKQLHLEQSTMSKLDNQHQNSHFQKQVKHNFDYFMREGEELSIYEYKMKSYRQLLFMINFAHKIFDPLTIIQQSSLPKSQRDIIPKYLFYVGPGNNSVLIRQLMKRRHWWSQTNDYRQANFVWTQLKNAATISSQQDWPYSTSQQQINYTPLKIIKKDHTKQVKNSFCKYFASNNKIKVNKLQSSLQNLYSFKAPFSEISDKKILTITDSNYYNNMLNSLSVLEFDNFMLRQKYLPNHFLKNRPFQQRLLVHNHFQFNHCLGNKKALYYFMSLYYKLKGKSTDEAFPKTYHIRSVQNDCQFQEFEVQYYRSSKMQEGYNLWIVKPGQNSNRGSGIKVINSIKQVKKIIKSAHKSKHNKERTFIVQKYIQKPLLYQDRKFDIRHYMLITGLYGKLRGYWFGEGYIRTSSYPFNLYQTNDRMIHLTNDAVQKNSEDYGVYEQGNKISYNELERYYCKTFPHRQFKFKDIYIKMKNLATEALHSTYLALSHSHKMHSFEIFGLDFMIQDNLSVKLIQINTNPCLEISSNLLSRIIPLMLEQSFRIGLDVIFPPNVHYNNNSKHFAPDCILQKLQCQLIFDQDRDGQMLKQLYSGHQYQCEQLMKNGQKQVEETFGNEGVEFEIGKLLN